MSDTAYFTRAEALDMRADLKAVEADVTILKDRQQAQQSTLDRILTAVENKNSVRDMLIAGGSGVGGGLAAGMAYLLHGLIG